MQVHVRLFRDDPGGPNLSPDAELRIELKDIAPDDLAEGIFDFLLSTPPHFVNS
jgi:hypothetical protein